MLLTISAISISAYLFSLFRYKGKWIQQQIVFLIIFLSGLTIIGELDVLLPIYFIVSLLPFIFKIRLLSKFTIVLSIYFIIYLVYGLVSQNVIGTLVTFISRIWQFVFFFLVYDAKIAFGKTNYRGTILFSLFIETLIGVYLMFTSTNIDTNGLVRLVANAQPITGNLSTVVLPLSVYYYVENRKDSKKTQWLLFVNLLMLVWIVLSGTRGYVLLFVGTMSLIFYDYYTNSLSGEISFRNKILLLFIITAMSLSLLLAVPNLLETVISILRLNSSIGIRVYENAAIKEFMFNAPIPNLIFGIGLGGIAGSYSAMANALRTQFSLGMWHEFHYMNNSGALFHNLYANVLLCLGILGAAMMIWLNIVIWKRISKVCCNQILYRRVMHLFQLSFLWMNYYRWSADCGIAEMCIFALVLKLIKQNNEGLEMIT